MKVIVAGSRSITDYSLVSEVIRLSGFEITELVSGSCPRGVDQVGEHWAKVRHLTPKRFPALWSDRIGTFNRRAAFERNEQMAHYADALVAVWDGSSHGTGHMISCMVALKKPIYTYNARANDRFFEGL